jgi:hypothetical protein
MTAIKFGAVLVFSACLTSAQLGWFHHDRHPAKNSAKKDARAEDAIVGLVARKTEDSFVIVALDTRIVTFKIADSTLYFRGWRWASPTLLTRGAVVKVDISADPDGILTATNIAFQDFYPVFTHRAAASALLPGGVTDDPLVLQARQALASWFGMLPNFLCQQSTTRSYAGGDKHWRTIDRVTAEVLYDHSHEVYRDVKVNGKLTGRSMKDLPGSTSTGEFGSTLRSLFDPETEALFKFQSSASLRGFSTAIYDFAVSGDHSGWRISAGSQSIMTSYTGRIWIDHNSGHVVRIEMKAADLPLAFPFERVEAEVDYGPVVLPYGRYFLPERAENVSCNNPKSCSRNVIEFRNYHKYVGESSISFDPPEAPEAKP